MWSEANHHIGQFNIDEQLRQAEIDNEEKADIIVRLRKHILELEEDVKTWRDKALDLNSNDRDEHA